MNIFDRPRTRQECPPAGKIAPRNTKLTLREFFTSNESKTKIIDVLKNLAETRSKEKNGLWKDYWEFYVLNQSGDMASFKPDGVKYAKKMLSDVTAEWAIQKGEDTDAVQEQSAATEVPRNGEAGGDQPQNGQGVRQGKQRQKTS